MIASYRFKTEFSGWSDMSLPIAAAIFGCFRLFNGTCHFKYRLEEEFYVTRCLYIYILWYLDKH